MIIFWAVIAFLLFTTVIFVEKRGKYKDMNGLLVFGVVSLVSAVVGGVCYLVIGVFTYLLSLGFSFAFSWNLVTILWSIYVIWCAFKEVLLTIASNN